MTENPLFTELPVRTRTDREDPSITYLRTFPSVNTDAIGPLLGKGWVHAVYEYREGTSDYVVKAPMKQPGVIIPSAAEKALQYEEAQLFHDFLVPTTVETSPYHPLYAYKQPRLHSIKPLSPQNIGLVRDQFEELIRLNHIAVNHYGKSLDFLGSEGLVECIKSLYGGNHSIPELSNLVVQTTPDTPARLLIIDIDLMHLRGRTDMRWITRANIVRERPMYELNRLFINQFYGVDIGSIRR